MPARLAFCVCMVLGILVATMPVAHAQQPHVVDPAQLQQLMDQREAEEARDRDALRRVMQRPEVRELAGRLRLDLSRAEAAVATLEGAELRDLAAQARTVDQGLAGGQNITISVTAIIIILLLVILLVVALK